MSNKFIRGLSGAGLAVSILLVYNNFRQPGYCPAFLNLPACWLVLLAFMLVLIAAFLKGRLSDILFYPGVFIGLDLAVWFSFHQVMGLKACPKYLNFPLCYVSLLTFLLIFSLKLVRSNNA